MTEEDEEFNRIERESRIKQDYVRDIKKPSREALMAEVAVLTELVRVLSDKVAERNAVLEGVALNFDKMIALGDTAASFAAYVRGMKS